VSGRPRRRGEEAGRTRRLFVAVGLPGEIKEALARLQDRFRDLGGRISWVRAEGMHVTLKFLGGTPVDRIPALVEALERAAGSCRPLEVRLAGTGVFPGPSRPRVLWVGLDRGAEGMAGVFAAVDRELGGVGFDAETRPFHPHVTLARIKALPDIAGLARRLSSLQRVEIGEMHVGEIHLMESRLEPGGAVYTSLARVELGRAGESTPSIP